MKKGKHKTEGKDNDEKNESEEWPHKDPGPKTIKRDPRHGNGARNH